MEKGRFVVVYRVILWRTSEKHIQGFRTGILTSQAVFTLYFRPEKSGVQAEADARGMRWGEEFVIMIDQMPDILFDYYSNVSTGQMRHKAAQVSSYLSI